MEIVRTISKLLQFCTRQLLQFYSSSSPLRTSVLKAASIVRQQNCPTSLVVRYDLIVPSIDLLLLPSVLCNLHCRTRHIQTKKSERVHLDIHTEHQQWQPTHLEERLLYFKSGNLNWHCEKPTGSRWASLPRGGRHRRWIKQIIVQCHWAGQAVVFGSHVSSSSHSGKGSSTESLMKDGW